MAKTWKNRKNSKRKGRKRRSRKLTVRRPLPVNGFPSKITCIHRYSEVVTIPASTNLNHVGTHTFNLSSMYDPNVTGTGSQPRGRDQMVNIYARYCVIGAKVTYKPVGPAILDAQGTIAGMAFGSAITQTSAFQQTNGYTDLIEQYAYRQQASIKNDVGATRALTRKYSLKKFLKHPYPLSDDVVTSLSSGSPGVGAYFHVWCCNPTGAAMPAIAFAVTIDYIVTWYRRLDITPS